jgi:calmodulin
MAEMKVFRDIDKDNSGFLDVNELCVAFENLGLSFTLREVQQIVAETDDDRSGKIDFDEFKKLLKVFKRK